MSKGYFYLLVDIFYLIEEQQFGKIALPLKQLKQRNYEYDITDSFK